MGANCNSCQWAIKIQLHSWNYCKLPHLLSFLGITEQSAVLNDELQTLLYLYVHIERSCPGHLIDFWFTHSMHAETLYACIAAHLDCNFLIVRGVARWQTKCCISTTKRTVGLKLERGLALGLSTMHQTQF